MKVCVIGASPSGLTTTKQLLAVAVCSGPFQTPEMDSVPDFDKLAGEVVHSSTYRNKRCGSVGRASSCVTGSTPSTRPVIV